LYGYVKRESEVNFFKKILLIPKKKRNKGKNRKEKRKLTITTTNERSIKYSSSVSLLDMLMAASLPLPSHSHASLSLNPLPSRFHRYHYFFLNPHPYKPHKRISTTVTLRRSTHNLTTAYAESFFRAQDAESPNPKLLLRLAASSVLLFLGCFGFGAVRPLRLPPALAAAPLQEEAQGDSYPLHKLLFV
jgi:hypothetical protein